MEENDNRVIFFRHGGYYMQYALDDRGDSFCYEWVLDAEAIYIPDGRLHFFCNLDKGESVCLAYSDVAVTWEATGERMFGVCIGNRYQAQYEQSRVEKWLEGLGEQDSFENRAEYCNAGFKAACGCSPAHPVLCHAVEQLVRTRGRAAVEDIAGEMGYTPRHLQRIFLEAFSFGPKRLGQYIRLQNVTDILRRFPERRLKDVAEQAGYSDQSHFQREFKRFAGMTPKEFIFRYI